MKEKVLKSESVFKGRILDVRVDHVRLPNGVESTREVLDHRPAVVILPMLSSTEVVLIEQYRHAVGKVMIEVPAGVMEPDETDPLEAAKRELAEETGYAAEKWTNVGEAYPAPGYCNELLHFYIAEHLSPVEAEGDFDELIETRPMSLSEMESLIRSRKITDSKTILSYYYAQTLGYASTV